jgi:hypothetical protein
MKNASLLGVGRYVIRQRKLESNENQKLRAEATADEDTSGWTIKTGYLEVLELKCWRGIHKTKDMER